MGECSFYFVSVFGECFDVLSYVAGVLLCYFKWFVDACAAHFQFVVFGVAVEV